MALGWNKRLKSESNLELIVFHNSEIFSQMAGKILLVVTKSSTGQGEEASSVYRSGEPRRKMSALEQLSEKLFTKSCLQLCIRSMCEHLPHSSMKGRSPCDNTEWQCVPRWISQSSFLRLVWVRIRTLGFVVSSDTNHRNNCRQVSCYFEDAHRNKNIGGQSSSAACESWMG